MANTVGNLDNPRSTVEPGDDANLAGGSPEAGAVPGQSESLCWRCGWVTSGICGWPRQKVPGSTIKERFEDGELLRIVTSCPLFWLDPDELAIGSP